MKKYLVHTSKIWVHKSLPLSNVKSRASSLYNRRTSTTIGSPFLSRSALPFCLQVIKAILFLLGGLMLVHALAYIANSIDPNGNVRYLLNDQKHVKQLLSQAQHLESIAIGNSHTGAINFEVLGYDGYKLARPDGDFFEIKYQLENLIPRTPAVKTVFVNVSYFSFLDDNTASDDVEFRRTDIYTVIPSWRFIEGDFENFIIGKSHLIFPVRSILKKDNWEEIFYITILGKIPEEDQFIEIAADDCRHMTTEALIDNIKSIRIAKYKRLTTEMAANNPDLDADIYETIVELIQYLHTQDIRVIFFTPPYSEAYTEYYQSVDPGAIALMKQNMQSLQQEYDVEYYDFSIDEEFKSDIRLFADGDHLNGCGAKLFSAKFKRILADNEPSVGIHVSR